VGPERLYNSKENTKFRDLAGFENQVPDKKDPADGCGMKKIFASNKKYFLYCFEINPFFIPVNLLKTGQILYHFKN